MLVEVLSFEDCPQARPAVELARRAVRAAGVRAEIRMVNVREAETQLRRFLGSPSIRVDGRDVEPDADARHDYAYGCRLYATSTGLRPLPPEAWVRNALLGPERGTNVNTSLTGGLLSS